jgi:drug/metabolite transporter (DMT)-like permease
MRRVDGQTQGAQSVIASLGEKTGFVQLTAQQNYGMLLGLFAVIAFSLTLPITRALTANLSVWDIGLGRSALAAFAAAAILLITRQKWPNQGQLIKLCIIASGITFGFPVLTALGMETVPASHGGIVLGSLPLATAIIGCYISGERPSGAFWSVAIIGFLIVATFVFITGNSESLAFYKGDIALVGAVLFAALGYAQGGVLARELGGWQVICWTLVISLPLLIPLCLLLVSPSNFITLDLSGWSIFVFLALINSLIGFFLFYRGMSLAGVARVSQIQLLQPFMTLLLAVIFLGEPLTATVALFTAATVLVVVISKRLKIT